MERRGEVDRRAPRRALQPHLLQEARRRRDGVQGQRRGRERADRAVVQVLVAVVVGDRPGEQAAAEEAPVLAVDDRRRGAGGGRVRVDARRRDGDDADREPGAVAQRHPRRRRDAVAQPALLGAVQPERRRQRRVLGLLFLRVGAGAPAQDPAGDRRARPAARQDEHRVVGLQGGEPPRRRVAG